MEDGTMEFVILIAVLLLLADRVQSRRDRVKKNGGTFISPGFGGGSDNETQVF